MRVSSRYRNPARRDGAQGSDPRTPAFVAKRDKSEARQVSTPTRRAPQVLQPSRRVNVWSSSRSVPGICAGSRRTSLCLSGFYRIKQMRFDAPAPRFAPRSEIRVGTIACVLEGTVKGASDERARRLDRHAAAANAVNAAADPAALHQPAINLSAWRYSRAPGYVFRRWPRQGQT